MKLTRKELKEISGNLILTDHAKERLVARGSQFKLEHIEQKVINSSLAWQAMNGDIKIKVGDKLLLIVRQDHNGYVALTTYFCSGRKSRGVNKKSSKTIQQHFDKDKKLYDRHRVGLLLNKI